MESEFEKVSQEDENQSEDKTGTVESEPQLSENKMRIIALVKRFFKAFGILLLAYLVGYLEFSFAWILICLIIWIIRLQMLEDQKKKAEIYRAIAENEERTITNAFKYLPNWVFFPDTERAEWVNKILKQMWPYIEEYTKTIIRESVEPSISSSLPSYFKGFRFEKVDLGNVPMRIGSVKCYDEKTSKDQIIMDLELIYAGNCDMMIKVRGLSAGLKDLQIYGTLRVEMKPLIKESPLIGGISFYFLNNPTIEFNLTNLADFLDMPGISDVLRRAISEQLAACMVLPNKYIYQMADAVSLEQLKFSTPIGVVRIEMIEAKELVKADIGMFGMGKSDPYCNIALGSQEFRTSVIRNTIAPKWDFICEAIVHHVHGQVITIEVMDEDQGSKDDFLGKTSIDLSNIQSAIILDEWLTLEDTESGLIHTKVTWLNLSSNSVDYPIQVESSRELRKKFNKNEGDHEGTSVVALSIYLDKIMNLNRQTNRAPVNPNPFVVFTIGKHKRTSPVIIDNADPVWEETYIFLLSERKYEYDLTIMVQDNKSNKVIGQLKYPIWDLLNKCDMRAEEKLKFGGKGIKESTISLIFEMRVLKEPISEMNSLEDGEMSKMKVNIPTIVEPEDEENGKGIPTLEQMVFSTVNPIIGTSGLKNDIILNSQESRTDNTLEDTRFESNPSDSQSNGNNFPQIQITIQGDEKERTSLIIHRIVNLPLDEGKRPDVFVKIQSIPKRMKDSKHRTQVRCSSINPIFEEMFEVGSSHFIPTCLELSVCQKMGTLLSGIFGNKSREIARTTIELSDLGNSHSITQWYDLELKSD